MKIIRLLIFIILNFSAINSNGQSLCKVVIGNAGGYFISGSYSLSCTVGESTTARLSSTNNVLTQGFQQPEACTTTEVLTIDKDYNKCLLYPNPSDHFLYFQANENISRVLVMDLMGRSLIVPMILNVESKYFSAILDISSLSASVYLLNSFNQEGRLFNSIKFIKTK